MESDVNLIMMLPSICCLLKEAPDGMIDANTGCSPVVRQEPQTCSPVAGVISDNGFGCYARYGALLWIHKPFQRALPFAIILRV